jgi:hypothetical protein
MDLADGKLATYWEIELKRQDFSQFSKENGEKRLLNQKKKKKIAFFFTIASECTNTSEHLGHRTQLRTVWLSSANVMRLEGEGKFGWVTKHFKNCSSAKEKCRR